MEKNEKAKMFQALFVFLIIAVILFMIFMVIWLKSMSGQCVKDPLSFYADHNTKEENCDPENYHYEISCSPNNISKLIQVEFSNISMDLYP